MTARHRTRRNVSEFLVVLSTCSGRWALSRTRSRRRSTPCHRRYPTTAEHVAVLVVSSPPLTLRGSVPSDEYDSYSSATLRLPPLDAGCCLVQCVTRTPSTTRRRRRHMGFPLTDVDHCTRRVVLECRLLPVGRLSSPSAAKNTDTRALLEHR